MQTAVNLRFSRISVLIICAALLLMISGCLYPKQYTPGQAVNVSGTVQAAQDAVNRYQQATGLLPIQNADASVPVYEKYRIDFPKMQRMGYIDSIPKLAFESGGPYIFLIVDEETDPKVKLLDAAVFQTITDVQRKVDAYKRESGGKLPVEGEAYPGFSYLDFKKLGMKQPDIKSMFSPRPLELMADSQGKVYADYGIDLAQQIREGNLAPSPEEDLRRILVERTPFVPVKSPEYRLVQDEPRAVPAA
jgi:hypothetical protein